MAVLPLLNVKEVQNAVMFDGPLNGAYIAQPEYLGHLVRYINAVGSNAQNANVPLADIFEFATDLAASRLAGSQWYKNFQAGASDTIIQKLESSMQAPVNVVKVAGTTPYPFETTLWQVLGVPHQTTNDGVIDQSSAQYPKMVGTANSSDVRLKAHQQTLQYAYNHTSIVPNINIDDIVEYYLEYVWEGGSGCPAEGMPCQPDSIYTAASGFTAAIKAPYKDVTYYAAPVLNSSYNFSSSIWTTSLVIVSGPNVNVSSPSPATIHGLTSVPAQYNSSNAPHVLISSYGDATAGASDIGLIFVPPSPSPAPSGDPQPTPRGNEDVTIEVDPQCVFCPSGNP